MFLDLLSAGLVHGYMQKNLSPWLEILAALKPFWWVRTFAGGMILVGQVLFVWNLWMTARARRSPTTTGRTSSAGRRDDGQIRQILLVAGLLCFAFSFLVSGIYPWMITDGRHKEATIEEVAHVVSPDFKALKESYPVAFAMTFPRAAEALTERELVALPAADPRRAASEDAWRAAYAHALRSGRDVYIREACWHCHSQFVRPVANEDIRFGPGPDAASTTTTSLQRPVLWGTRRVGPDLTHEGGLPVERLARRALRGPEDDVAGLRDAALHVVLPRGIPGAPHDRAGRRRARGASLRPELPVPGIHETQGRGRGRPRTDPRDAARSRSTSRRRGCSWRRPAGRTATRLSLIAYLQWLGTWTPKALAER